MKKTKTKTTDWEKIFENHISNEGLIFRTYKELSKFNSKKQTIQLIPGQQTFHQKICNGK